MFCGVKVTTSAFLTERVLHARSPTRARRRELRGYPQHYVVRPRQDVLHMPDGSLVMHPATWAHLRATLAQT